MGLTTLLQPRFEPRRVPSKNHICFFQKKKQKKTYLTYVAALLGSAGGARELEGMEAAQALQASCFQGWGIWGASYFMFSFSKKKD